MIAKAIYLVKIVLLLYTYFLLSFLLANLISQFHAMYTIFLVANPLFFVLSAIPSEATANSFLIFKRLAISWT